MDGMITDSVVYWFLPAQGRGLYSDYGVCGSELVNADK